ncbi:M14 family metallopeptidase [Flagellimonas sp. HMM57]|uniref:M14 family metallopeptidase n=1 Tax=unclassified Flagellimonas TaxID=2644544 RepID=UPI0013D837F5|nr:MULTISPECIES: M14 family metallopeptidase [unclassified Flagellimonas]UII76643.1 M14 family metallopeptidase [Flagellimonas sp. HMM57]
MKYLIIICIFLFFASCETATEDKIDSYKTCFEISNQTETPTYEETIAFYIKLAKDFPEINIQTIGITDSGYPLHIVTFNTDGDFNFENIREENAVILINNGIHPGESDGIDATMLLYRDLALKKIEHPKQTILVTIPIYNIGGALQRNSTTRVNQNGPLEYGFRGNARNYDLNRDFIKMDTKNAQTFAKIFHLVKPDIFIDNHVSNGADYQYTLTHLFTQHNKLGGEMGKYLHREFMPNVEESLRQKKWDITPYVNVFNQPPEMGFNQFMDHPRYSTGYTTLWNTLGLMVETHMLKPYDKRVEGTYEVMQSVISVTEKNHDAIKSVRKSSLEKSLELSQYHFNWQVDTTQNTILNFKGFEAEFIESEVTGLTRLKYNKNRPFTKKTVYHNYFYPKDTVKVPSAYIIKKGWHKVMDKLKANNIRFSEIEEDTTLNVSAYEIVDFETRKSPYEGHYLHSNTKVKKSQGRVAFRAGDFLIPTDQPGIRYILETLEPSAVDSFFNWNFFDTVLQQKEGFSPYVFEDVALQMLQKDSTLRNMFTTKKKLDKEFAENWYAQLDWLYQRSEHKEESYLNYPVYRIEK